MNKMINVALIAGSLLLLDAPEAAAHAETRFAYHPSTHHVRLEHRRQQHMPYWLKRDRAFRHWYRHTRLRGNRRLSWHRLFDIYHWERRTKIEHRRARHLVDTYHYYRDYDREARRRHRR